MGGEPASDLNPIKDAVGRRQFTKARGVRSVRAVDPECGAVAAEDLIEKKSLNGRGTESVANVNEDDARCEFREFRVRSWGTGVHNLVDGWMCERGGPWTCGESGSGIHYEAALCFAMTCTRN